VGLRFEMTYFANTGSALAKYVTRPIDEPPAKILSNVTACSTQYFGLRGDYLTPNRNPTTDTERPPICAVMGGSRGVKLGQIHGC
jgi:hypothetical protein